MKKFIFNKLAIVLFVTLAFTACKDNDPEVVNEEEVITTVNITLTPAGGGTAVTLQFRDPDGEDGPLPGVYTPTTGVLAANTVYNGTIELLNETETPAEDITEEIEEEDDEHQFFFAFTNNVATAAYSDMDGNGNPVGLSFTLTTTAAATGNFNVVLVHEPAKTAAGVSGGDQTNAGGSEDINVTFALQVQ